MLSGSMMYWPHKLSDWAGIAFSLRDALDAERAKVKTLRDALVAISIAAEDHDSECPVGGAGRISGIADDALAALGGSGEAVEV